MVGIDESLFGRLAASVRDGHEVAVLSAHVAALASTSCVVLLPRRDAWSVDAAARIALDVGRLRLRDHEIEGWLASASGRPSWFGLTVQHGEAPVARVMILEREISDEVIAACAVAAPFLAARRSRTSPEIMHSTVAQIVHDLGQPIAALALAHDALAHAGRLDPILLERARRSVSRLRELTGDLLLLASPRKRRVETVPLGPLLSELVSEEAHRAASLHVRLALEVRAEVSLRGGRLALLRGVGNVLANAISFAPPGSVVQVVLDSADRVSVEVRDAGPGVEPALRTRVFEPFFTTRPGGNGLGLAVAKRVAQQHGGTVGFLDGPGGIVRFEFPPSRIVGHAQRALAPMARPAIL